MHPQQAPSHLLGPPPLRPGRSSAPSSAPSGPALGLALVYWCLVASQVKALSEFHWSSWGRVAVSTLFLLVSLCGPGAMLHQNPHRRRGYQPMPAEPAGGVGA